MGTGNLGTANWISPAAVENGGALGHALMGQISSMHGQKSQPAAAPETRFQRPRIAPRSAIRWEGHATGGASKSPRKPLKKRLVGQPSEARLRVKVKVVIWS